MTVVTIREIFEFIEEFSHNLGNELEPIQEKNPRVYDYDQWLMGADAALGQLKEKLEKRFKLE